MPRFAANLSMLYPEHAFLDRFEAAARDGFEAVEFMFPYEFEAREIAARLKGNGLQQVLFNGPPGEGTERGLASVPGREAAFRASIALALRYAEMLDCPRIHVMAGLDGQRETYVANLRWAAQQARGVDLLLEPINTRDVPGYFLNRQDRAHEVVEEIGAPNVKVQMDLYHCQIVEGDVATKIRRYLPTGRVGHMQVAGVPQRHEPNLGELNYPYLFEVIDETGYDGWVGCEYRPAGGTSAGLDWLRRWRASRA
ncbi:MAG: hydroxypyruvate isomerase family protein [Burkholderiales bacterium]|nr:hydroxypyruvate isomerase family protein [Burkholderiales bacterium]